MEKKIDFDTFFLKTIGGYRVVSPLHHTLLNKITNIYKCYDKKTGTLYFNIC